MKMRCMWAILSVAVLMCIYSHICPASETHPPSPPDPAAIFEQARIAESGVVFSENFDGNNPSSLEQIYWGDTPNKVIFSGLTKEQALSGAHSYKVSVTFEPVAGKTGTAYFLLPIEIPAWSDLKLKWRFRTIVSPPATIRPFHGFIGGDLEAGESRNVAPYVGHKTDETNGWETWEATARKTGKVGEHVAGAAVYFQIKEIDVPTTVTLYIDDVSVTSRLPVNWRETMADAARYFSEVGDRKKRLQAEQRLATIKEWRNDAEDRRKKCVSPSGDFPIVLEHYKSVIAKIDDMLSEAEPLIENIETGLADPDTRFTANVNAAERLVFEARHYVSTAESYARYDAAVMGKDIVAFGLDPTQCYPILPWGPKAHEDELSYYGWNQNTDSFENPHILPETKPVPARPTTSLSNFGCPGIYAPYSFAIHAGRELRELAFACSDLESSNGVIPSSAVDLRIVGPWYRPYGGKLRLMNEPLLHDP